MNKIKLKLGEILLLDDEINGIYNEENKEIFKGFIKQPISLYIKYQLTSLSDVINKEKEKITKLREELILKYGEKNEDETISLSYFINEEQKIINDKFISFNNEFNEFLSKDKEIEYEEMDKDELKKITTSESYPILFKFFK